MSDPWQNTPSGSKPPFWFDLAGAPLSVDRGGGTLREANAGTFKALQGLSIYLLTLEPGAVRIPHWHPDCDEVQYILGGQCHIGLISNANGNNPGTDYSFDLSAGMIGYIPRGWFHYIQNKGNETATMLIIFDNENPNDTDISWGFRITPPSLLRQVFGIDFEGMETNQIWFSAARRPDEEPGS